MAEYIDKDAVFIAGDEAYLDYSVMQTARLNISAAYVVPSCLKLSMDEKNIFREVY